MAMERKTTSVGKTYTILSLDLVAQRSTQSNTPSGSKESNLSSSGEGNSSSSSSSNGKDVISITILDPADDTPSDRTSPSVEKTDSKNGTPASGDEDHAHCSSSAEYSAEYRSSDTGASEIRCDSATNCYEHGNSAELFRAYPQEDSGDPGVVVDETWLVSDSSASIRSEQKTDTAAHSSGSEQTMQKQQNMKEKKSSRDPKEMNTDRLQILARPRTELYKKLAELKAFMESEKLQECSFKPCVGRKPGPDSIHFAPISQRLIKIQQRIELRKRARKAYEKEELNNCSFWPRVNCSFWSQVNYQPLQERLQAFQKKKLEKTVNASLHKDIGLTFKPVINRKSIELCKQNGLEGIHVSDRLTRIQQSVHLDCKLEPQRNIGKFAPEINKNTDLIIASSKKFGGGSIGFLERQKYYMQKTEEKKRSKEQGMPPDLTFRPDIGNSTLILKQSNGHDILEETCRQRVERLAYKDKEQVAHAREKAAEDYYSQFHFQPEIDEVSRALARSNSIHDLYKNERGKKIKEALEQAAHNEYQQRCPFRPELNSRLRNNEDHQSSILQRRQRKEKAHYEYESRTLKELEEMKECTFKPSVNRARLREVAQTAPAAIKGLERHLQLQTSAKQMKRNQEELERKVFFSHAYTSSIRQYTIPRPFVLQTGQGRFSGRR